MQQALIERIKILKKELQKEGFIIDAIFGSVARNEADDTSDIDLLYHIEPHFLQRYSGFRSFKRLEEIKSYLQRELHKRIDLAPSNGLSQTAKEHIYKEAIFV